MPDQVCPRNMAQGVASQMLTPLGVLSRRVLEHVDCVCGPLKPYLSDAKHTGKLPIRAGSM